jgi:hypothetical protein
MTWLSFSPTPCVLHWDTLKYWNILPWTWHSPFPFCSTQTLGSLFKKQSLCHQTLVSPSKRPYSSLNPVFIRLCFSDALWSKDSGDEDCMESWKSAYNECLSSFEQNIFYIIYLIIRTIPSIDVVITPFYRWIDRFGMGESKTTQWADGRAWLTT